MPKEAGWRNLYLESLRCGDSGRACMFEFLLSRHVPDRTLVQYRAGLLDQERSDTLEAHLLLCPTC